MADDTESTAKPHVEALTPTFRVGFVGITLDYEHDKDSTLEGESSLTPDAGAVDAALVELELGKVFVYVRDPTAAAPQLTIEYVIDEAGRAYRTTSPTDPTPDRKKPLILTKGKSYEFWHSHTQLQKLEATAAAAAKVAAAKQAQYQAQKDKEKSKKPSEALDRAARANERAADEAKLTSAESIPKFVKREAASTITLPSCADLAEVYEQNKDGILLHRTHDAYFYRGHLALDVDGAPNAYGPTARDLAYMRNNLKRPRKPKEGQKQIEIPGYADSYDEKGELRHDFDEKNGYLKFPAKKASKIWFIREDTGAKITSDDPEFKDVRDAKGALKMGIADALESALYHAPAKKDKEPPKWDGLKSDHQGRPYVRMSGPYKGYFISKAGMPINPLELPAISVPPYNVGDARKKLSAKAGKALVNEMKGDIALVSLVPRGEKKLKAAFAIVYECGGSTTGEGTPMLRKLLGMYGDRDPRKFMTRDEFKTAGSSDYRFAYLILRGSSPKEKAEDLTPAMLAEQGKEHFKSFGGVSRLRCCFPELFYSESHVKLGPKAIARAKAKADKEAAKKAKAAEAAAAKQAKSKKR
ncbi:MAG: hypothetical protein U0271_05385 [Polyangiaceae bacterium]